MIFFMFHSSPVVLIYDFKTFIISSSSFLITNQLNDQLRVGFLPKFNYFVEHYTGIPGFYFTIAKVESALAMNFFNI